MATLVWSRERGLRALRDGASFETYRERYPSAVKVKQPSIATLERWSNDGICKAMDGCRTEPDGDCSHGYPSWLLALGLI